MQKISQEYLDSNFWEQFQDLTPGIYPDQANNNSPHGNLFLVCIESLPDWKRLKIEYSAYFSRKNLTTRRYFRTFWVLWRHFRRFVESVRAKNQSKVTFSSYFDQANSPQDVWHPKKNFSIWRIFIDRLGVSLISAWLQNIQNAHQKCKNMIYICEKLLQNDVSTWTMTYDMQK